MVVDLSKYKSHPHKELTVHTQGVLDQAINAAKVSPSTMKMAEIAAIFHDLGKMNPNFQDKFKPVKEGEGYSNHAYLSAYGFFCFLNSNRDFLINKLGDDWRNKIISIIAIIAKHHGDLSDFDSIVKMEECKRLFDFVKIEQNIPTTEFIQSFLPETQNFDFSNKPKFQSSFSEKLGYSPNDNNLSNFLETQFAFASLIQADKIDAGDYELERDKQKVIEFCDGYQSKLAVYLDSLNSVSELNALRTRIRIEATDNIKKLLETTDQRVFALTAPTGAGKTLMLLSLADKIIQSKGPLRIIYSIPFLSITEQVENECLKIFGNEFVKRIDSKSENEEFEKLQKQLESNPEKAKDIITARFIEDIFLSPFIITTFVRFFETIVSNRNSTLLKLPSFSNCIFLIDEIQSLPPRLYTFFTAYLSEFCKKFNSYCIISTATMPSFEIKDSVAKTLFKEFKEPNQLLSLEYFNHQLFNRYRIEQKFDSINMTELSEMVIAENNSVLVILNTIDDTKELFEKLREEFNGEELLLLNTHFTPNDRKYKIKTAKERLSNSERVILISTQLIEAGVDIDFPVLYRDMATIPSIIQSAGRCNRNGKLEKLGKVVVLNLAKDEKSRADLIYRGKDRILLKKTRNVLKEHHYDENQLFETQQLFFKILGTDLIFGDVEQKKPQAKFLFVDEINKLGFETIGKFRLIDEDFYGEEFRCYIPEDENDKSFETLKQLDDDFKKTINIFPKDFAIIMTAKFKIEQHLKKMSNQILQIRIKKEDVPPLTLESYFDLHLIDNSSYSKTSGIILNSQNQII